MRLLVDPLNRCLLNRCLSLFPGKPEGIDRGAFNSALLSIVVEEKNIRIPSISRGSLNRGFFDPLFRDEDRLDQQSAEENLRFPVKYMTKSSLMSL